MTVKQILQSKSGGSQVWSTSPSSTVYEALQLMAEKDIGALVVIEAGKLVGIFSERDYARKVILQGRTSRVTLVRDVMTPQVICIHQNQSAEECMAIMTDKHIRHLPVLDGDRMIGLVSIGDVVKAIISQQGFEIQQLQTYITGSR